MRDKKTPVVNTAQKTKATKKKKGCGCGKKKAK